MDADKVRELIAETRERVEIRNQALQPMAMGGNTTTAILMACELSRRLAPQLADACEVLLAERDKLIERNWYLEHDEQHDVLKLQERVAELEAAGQPFADEVKHHHPLMGADGWDTFEDGPIEECPLQIYSRVWHGKHGAKVGDCFRMAELLAKKEPTNG